MKRFMTAAAAAIVALAGLSGAAAAQPGPHRGPPAYGHDHHWKRGDRMDRDMWRRGARVDWRRHHLRAPPRGYEWRQVNGDYVLAAAATGLIASIIIAGH